MTDIQFIFKPTRINLEIKLELNRTISNSLHMIHTELNSPPLIPKTTWVASKLKIRILNYSNSRPHSKGHFWKERVLLMLVIAKIITRKLKDLYKKN